MNVDTRPIRSRKEIFFFERSSVAKVWIEGVDGQAGGIDKSKETEMHCMTCVCVNENH